jgi:uncharacterized protein YdeI (YjbR/CyaY-like superfamily)
MAKPRFFRTPSQFRRWLETHHDTATELVVGFYKVGSGKPSITWPESVDEALCFGWIDGIRRSLDESAYTIRFTPRRPKSTWSAVNIRRAEALIRDRRMTRAGRTAFQKRDPAASGRYSFENRPRTLAPDYLERFKANEHAWAFFQAQAPWYRRTAIFWIMEAKREDTRQRRLGRLIDDSAHARTIPPLTRSPRGKK